MKNLLDRLSGNVLFKNISWIFIGNFIHSLLKFFLNIWVARKFSYDDFGLINYANSIILLVTSVGSLGFEKIIPKMFAFDEKRSSEYLGSSIIARCIFAVVSIVGMQFVMYVLYPKDVLLRFVVFCESFTVLFNAFTMYIHWFRYKNRSDTVAIMRLLAFAISAVWRIVILILCDSMILYVVGVVLENICFSLFLSIGYKKANYSKLKYSWDATKSMIAKSYPFIFSALLITVYAQTDKIMLKSMMDNNAVALYSVSVNLAGALSIIPTALIDGFTPEIMRAKQSCAELYYMRLKQLYAIVFWMSIAYCVFVTVFAKQIILLIYGTKYLGAVPSLALIVWYTSFSYFGAINNLYMVAENKAVWVQVLTLSGAIFNVVLNYVLIPVWGIVGAAFASLCTQIVTNFLLLLIIKPLRENFMIILSGISMEWVKVYFRRR